MMKCAVCGESLKRKQVGQLILNKKTMRAAEYICNDCLHLGCESYPCCEDVGYCEQESCIEWDYDENPNGICGVPG